MDVTSSCANRSRGLDTILASYLENRKGWRFQINFKNERKCDFRKFKLVFVSPWCTTYYCLMWILFTLHYSFVAKGSRKELHPLKGVSNYISDSSVSSRWSNIWEKIDPSMCEITLDGGSFGLWKKDIFIQIEREKGGHTSKKASTWWHVLILPWRGEEERMSLSCTWTYIAGALCIWCNNVGPHEHRPNYRWRGELGISVLSWMLRCSHSRGLPERGHTLHSRNRAALFTKVA